MIVWIIIYIIGVLLVGGVFAWYIKEIDDDVNLYDLIKMITISFGSWASVVLFIAIIVSTWMEKYCSKVIIKKGKKEEEE